jgi:hypothetical protein
MSLRSHPMSTVPAETARVAQAVYPKGNLYMTLRDELGSLYTGCTSLGAYTPNRWLSIGGEGRMRDMEG